MTGAFGIVAALCAGASAHAVLERAEPLAGSRVTSSPPRVTLRFTERLEPAYSTVSVTDASGRRVDRDDSQVDPSDRAVLRVSLPPLPRGTYRVFWRVLSIDTHVSEGEYRFTVAP